jgi:hypothetical protein
LSNSSYSRCFRSDQFAFSNAEFLTGNGCRLTGYCERMKSARSVSIKTQHLPIFAPGMMPRVLDTGTWQRRRGSLDRESGRRVRVTPLTRRCRPNTGARCMHRAPTHGCVGRSAARQGKAYAPNAATRSRGWPASEAGQRSVAAGASRCEQVDQRRIRAQLFGVHVQKYGGFAEIECLHII